MDQQTVVKVAEYRNKPQVWFAMAAVLLIIVEVSWLVPWYLGVIEISYVTTTQRASLVFGGVMLEAYLVTHLAENLRLRRDIQHILLAGLFLINMALTTSLLLDPDTPNHLNGLINLEPGPVLVVLAGAWLWWRGITLAQSTISPTTAWSRFWFGILMLVAFLLVVTRVAHMRPNSIPFIIFLAAGLLALIVSRVAYISHFHGSMRNPFGRGWIAAITATVTCSILLAALFASLLTGQFKPLLEQLTGALRWFVQGLIFLVSIPGLILAYILAPLIEAFQAFMLRSTVPASGATPYVILTPVAPPNFLQPAEPVMIPPWIVSLLFWTLVLFITAAIFGRLRTIAFWRSAADLDEPEALLDRDEMWRRIRQNARQQIMGAKDRLGALNPKNTIQAVYIRRIYASLMEIMKALEKPRLAGVTPLEFLPATQQQLTGVNSDLELITQMYVRTRYGELPETPSEISQLEQAWKRISEEGERQQKLYQATHKRLADEHPTH